MEKVFEITLTITTDHVNDESELDRIDWTAIIQSRIPGAYVNIIDSRVVHEPE